MRYKLLAFIVAGCLLILGFGSPPPPYLDQHMWPILYIPLSVLIIWTAYRPDRFKLRWATAIACTASVVRGMLFVLKNGWYNPIALFVLLTCFCIEFYEYHAPFLPEHYGKRIDPRRRSRL